MSPTTFIAEFGLGAIKFNASLCNVWSNLDEEIAFYPNVLYWLVAVLYSAISYFDVYLLAFWTKKAIQQKLATYGFSKKNQLWCSHYGLIRSWGAQKQSTFWEDLREKNMIIEANWDLRGGQMAITFDWSEIILKRIPIRIHKSHENIILNPLFLREFFSQNIFRGDKIFFKRLKRETKLLCFV